MASKKVIERRRKLVVEMLEDGRPIREIASYLGISTDTCLSDWRAAEKEYRDEHGWCEKLDPHMVVKLANCCKIRLLVSLGYSERETAELLDFSQGHINRLKRWTEQEGYYGNTGLRVNVHDGLATVDKERWVPPATYFVFPMNDENVFLSSIDDKHSCIVSLDDLARRHTLVSAYLRDYDDVPVHRPILATPTRGVGERPDSCGTARHTLA